MDTELRWEGEGAVGSAGSYLAQYICSGISAVHELLTRSKQRCAVCFYRAGEHKMSHVCRQLHSPFLRSQMYGFYFV